MGINFTSLTLARRKAALNTIIDTVIVNDAIKRELKNSIDTENVGDAVSLIMLTDEEIARMEYTKLERVGEVETERSYPISVGCRNHVKRVREYLIYLSGPQEHYAPADKITEANLAAKLTVDLFETHAMLALTKSSGPNFDKQITAVDKYDVKLFPHFDGSIQKYPTWQRQNIQVLRNFGMSSLADVNTVPPDPATVSTSAYDLWKKQNQFVKTAYTLKLKNGQACIIVREHADSIDGALEMFKAIVAYYESPANQSMIITHVLSAITKLSYSNRSNCSIGNHLTEFQNHIQDLNDCGHQATEPWVKSTLCASVKHTEFTAMIDMFLNDSTMTSATMISQLNQKGERMSNPKVPRNRNLNFTKTNAKNGKNKPGGNKNGNRQTGNKGGKKKFYVPPEQYKNMTAEQFQAAKAKYYAQDGNQTPVPSSNYSQANQMQTVLQLLAMTDSQRQDLQRATSQINTIQQNFPGLNLANAASMVTSQQQVATAQPATGNSQVNFLTQLLNASTQQAPSGSASRNIFAATTVTVVDPDKPDTRTRNPNVPKRVVPGVKYLLDTSEMEFSDLPLYNEASITGTEISSIPQDCNGSVTSCTLSDDSIPKDGDSVDGSIPSCDSINCNDDSVTHDDSFNVDPPSTQAFLDTLSINESGPVVCKYNNNDPHPSVLLLHEEEDYFSDALELPEDVFYDAQAYSNDGYLEPPPPLVALWDVYPEDPFVFTNNEVIVGTRQAYFNVSVIGNIETLLYDGYSPVDSGADTVYCGGDCVNEEIYHNREVHVIGVHGDDNKPSFQIGTNLTTVHGEDGEKYLGRFFQKAFMQRLVKHCSVLTRLEMQDT